MATADPIAGLERAAPPVAPGLRAMLAGTALAAIGVPLLVVSQVKVAPLTSRPLATAAKVVPPTIVPAVEPVLLQQLSQDTARAINAAIPFSAALNPAARPFTLGSGAEDGARATDCLAAAMLYEAGDDLTGERAVGQVIINRVRHPAFPKTVCGVVFQGAEKRTGCQFTFTCDGALVRHQWSAEAWARARAAAAGVLTGQVFAPVGYATHYHTDWVVPYWSASLDKVAAIGTHLFFRWTGWWGTPPAFRRQVEQAEPVIAALAAYSPAHRLGLALTPTDLPGMTIAPGALAPPRPTALDPDAFIVALDPRLPVDSYRAYAEQSCGARAYCKFMAWNPGTALPRALPLDTGQIAAMAFSYLRDDARGLDRALWNCGVTPRSDKRDCMKTQSLRASRAEEADAAPLLYDRPELLVPKAWLILPKSADKPAGAPVTQRSPEPGVPPAGRAGATAPASAARPKPVAMPSLLPESDGARAAAPPLPPK